ncbi:flagellin [Butyrivibrio proteoclasticus]|uniref:Flagellin n=1 Tax=Butyrivibrio proteoclasticus TaxID=43305 RepID=A0A1I5YHA3_9FIRM|nr:flagellinolysin [Butyrivibrio proteoclasticus]SFQ43520.1 flagellin [Butyrivibrio proteoclasticus]
MDIQHNITAMNSNRQLGITTGLQRKSSEKLSSGYKVNRAADDAAGLAISEKMRRQVRGLSQASYNAQDGISFVQIADGALHEVHDMIQRGNELAIKAANDTLTAEDRSYINQEITKLKEEIDAVGGKTTFNEIPIFPANGAAAREATAEQKELLERIATKMIPNAVSQMVSALSGSLGNRLNTLAGSNADIGAMDLQISYIDGPSNTLAYMQGGFYGRNGAVDIFAAESLLMKVDSADYTSNTLDESTEQMLESTIAHELMHGLMDLTLPEGMWRADADTSLNFPKWFVEGTAQLIGGGFTTGWNDALFYMSDETAVANYLRQYTVEDRVYGHGYLACAYLCQLASGQSGVSQGSLQSGANAIFNALLNNYDNYANGGTVNSFEDTINSVISGSCLTVSQVISNINNGEGNAASFVKKLVDASRSSSSLNGAGSIIASGGLSSTDVLGSSVSAQQAMFVKGASASGTSGGDDATLILQVGSESSSDNQIALKRFAMSASAIGVSNANTLTSTDALEAIGYFKGALMNISAMRSYYGAMQNRLEHTVKNLDNVVENTQAAESRIRDTDMAEEMVRYSNQNILQQAGQSMLAQANQTNQGVLSLLQ